MNVFSLLRMNCCSTLHCLVMPCLALHYIACASRGFVLPFIQRKAKQRNNAQQREELEHVMVMLLGSIKERKSKERAGTCHGVVAYLFLHCVAWLRVSFLWLCIAWHCMYVCILDCVESVCVSSCRSA